MEGGGACRLHAKEVVLKIGDIDRDPHNQEGKKVVVVGVAQYLGFARARDGGDRKSVV
mgnify:FL=1